MDGLSSYELNDDELREFAQELSKIATDNNNYNLLSRLTSLSLAKGSLSKTLCNLQHLE